MVSNPSAGPATIELHTGRSQTPDGFPLERRLDNSGSRQVKNARLAQNQERAARGDGLPRVLARVSCL